MEKNYNVNPFIYALLYFISIPPFWYGIYLMVKSLIENKNKKFIWKEAINNSKFSWGLLTTIFSWSLPLVYAVIWGRNLPFWFYILIVFSVILFLFGLRKRIENKTYYKKDTQINV